MTVCVQFYERFRRPLPPEEHERACEGLIEALAMHITRFRDSALAHVHVINAGKDQIGQLRRKRSIRQSKNKKVTAAHQIRNETTKLSKMHQASMKDRMSRIAFLQNLLQEQLATTSDLYPDIARLYRAQYINLAELLNQPVQPAILEALPEKEHAFVQLWIEIRKRLASVFRAERFTLPSFEDLGISIPQTGNVRLALL